VTVPALAGPGAYAASLADPAVWGPLALDVCRRHRLDPGDGAVRMGAPGTFPVAVVGGRWAVKVGGPWWSGTECLGRERDAYEALAARPALPVPRLVAAGDLGGGWRYLVLTAVAGRSLREVPPTPAVARWLGATMAEVHAVPVPAGLEVLRPGWDGYLAWLADARAAAVGRHRGYGTLAPHLLEELAAWLPAPDDLVDRSRPAALLHGDLRADHVLVDDGGRPVAVLDWSDATVGDPRYELGPLLDVLGGDPALLAAYLDAAGDPPPDPRSALATALLHGFDQLGDAGVDTSGAADLDDLAGRLFGAAVRRASH
jgi:hypothetical protein